MNAMHLLFIKHLLRQNLKLTNNPKNVKTLGEGSFGQGAVSNECRAGNIWIKIILIGVCLIFRQGIQLTLNILFKYFNQKIGKKAVTAAQDIVAQNSGTTEGT